MRHITRWLLLTALLAGALAALSAGPAAAAETGGECISGVLPRDSIATCDGVGSLVLDIQGGSIIGSVDAGMLSVIGTAQLRFRRSVVYPSAPSTYNRRTRKTTFTGTGLNFFLPTGRWRVELTGKGISISSRGQIISGTISGTDGIWSAGGRSFVDWPETATRFLVGTKVRPAPARTRRAR
ncbi:MAG: hypothetical protein R3C15_05135 [Thermoleophilia bacterium]